MTAKERMYDLLNELSDDVSMKDLVEKVLFVAAVQEGLDELDRGEFVSLEEVKKSLSECAAK